MSCSYDGATHTVTANVTGLAPPFVLADGIGRNGDTITYGYAGPSEAFPQCGSATVFNTDTVIVNNPASSGEPGISTELSPGFTDEPGGSDEIEIVLNFGSGPDGFEVGSDAPGPREIRLGASGAQGLVNLNGAETDGIDADVTLNGVDHVLVFGGGASDDIRADGSAGTGGSAFPGRLSVTAGLGDDVVSGGLGDDDIAGGDGNDTLDGAGGRDEIHGGDGNDSLAGGPGGDIRIDGEDGDDHVVGGSGDDPFLDGGRGVDLIEGGGGVDRLNGEAGDDLLRAGAGADRKVEGDAGNDRIFGGPGADRYLTGADGNDRIFGEQGADDEVRGGSGTDVIFGGPSGDDLAGETGNDRLFGQGGDDALNGGPGSRDECRGGSGHNRLRLCEAPLLRGIL